MSAPDLSTQIQQGATDPASATADGVSVSAKPIADLILADQYLAGKTAASLPHRGLRFSILRGPAQHGGRARGEC